MLLGCETVAPQNQEYNLLIFIGLLSKALQEMQSGANEDVRNDAEES